MGVLDVWLLLYVPYPGLYNKTHIQNVYNGIRKKLKPLILNLWIYFSDNIIILSVSSDDFKRLIQYWKTVKYGWQSLSLYIYIYMYEKNIYMYEKKLHRFNFLNESKGC